MSAGKGRRWAEQADEARGRRDAETSADDGEGEGQGLLPTSAVSGRSHGRDGTGGWCAGSPAYADMV